MLVNNFLLSQQVSSLFWKVELYSYGELIDSRWIDLDKTFEAGTTMSKYDGEIFAGWATEESLKYINQKSNKLNLAAIIQPGTKIRFNEKITTTDRTNFSSNQKSLIFSDDEKVWEYQTLKLYAVFGVPDEKTFSAQTVQPNKNLSSQYTSQLLFDKERNFYNSIEEEYFYLRAEYVARVDVNNSNNTQTKVWETVNPETLLSSTIEMKLYNADGKQKDTLYPYQFKDGYFYYIQPGESISLTNYDTEKYRFYLMLYRPKLTYTYRYTDK